MKVSIIGIGSVGAAVATAVKNTGLVHEIALYDRDNVRFRVRDIYRPFFSILLNM